MNETTLTNCSKASDQSTTLAIFSPVSTFLMATVEQALQILEERVKLTCHGLDEYYILSMIIGLVKCKLWPESCVTSDKEAADRVVRICTVLQTRQAFNLPDQFTFGPE
jgi:hypothetical protein